MARARGGQDLELELIFQTHCDIISDFSKAFVDEITRLSDEMDFVIFEDRKFADIGEYRVSRAGGEALFTDPLSRTSQYTLAFSSFTPSLPS